MHDAARTGVSDGAMSGSPQREIAARILDWYQGNPRGPYTLELYPTLRCNLDCAFCDTTYRKARRQDELPADRYRRLIDEAADLEVRRCYILGGGEPLVAREVVRLLVRGLKAHNIYGILGTNGTLFTNEMLEEMVAVGWDEIHFSIDGATPAVHDRLRGRRGVFDKVTRTIRSLRDLKRRDGTDTPRMVLHTVVTRENYRQLGEIVTLARELGCFRVNFDALIAYRPEQFALSLSPEDRANLPEVARKALELAGQCHLETTLEQFLETRTLERGHMRFPAVRRHDVLHAACLNPWHHLVVQHNGKVGPCCVIPPEDGADDIRTRSLADVWFRGPTFTNLRNAMVSGEMTPYCRNCSMAIISQNDAIRRRFGLGLADDAPDALGGSAMEETPHP